MVRALINTIRGRDDAHITVPCDIVESDCEEHTVLGGQVASVVRRFSRHGPAKLLEGVKLLSFMRPCAKHTFISMIRGRADTPITMLCDIA
eukprot:2533345-Lingulodinium_polyedra.AAC.1